MVLSLETEVMLLLLELAALELAASDAGDSSSIRTLMFDALWTSIYARGLLAALCLAHKSCTAGLLFSLPKILSTILLHSERDFGLVQNQKIVVISL
jgi:hypothetical protein